MSVAGLLLFTLEVYHAIAHFCVLFRVRMLPKRDLVKVKYYFLVDLLSVSTCMLYTRQLIWLGVLQNLQHLYFFVTWNKSNYCIKVINWSSLDWLVGEKSRKDLLDVAVGTAFDMMVHVIYALILSWNLAFNDFITSAVLLVGLCRLVLFNPKFAWANPKWIPEWVGKRVRPVV